MRLKHGVERGILMVPRSLMQNRRSDFNRIEHLDRMKMKKEIFLHVFGIVWSVAMLATFIRNFSNKKRDLPEKPA